MACNYDENMEDNPFLLGLRKSHSGILRRAVKEKWLICIPRKATVEHDKIFTRTEILEHILVPGVPDNTYTTLTDQKVQLQASVLIYSRKTNLDIDNPSTRRRVNVLFTEDIYDTFGKYKLLCLENPLFSDKPSELLFHVNSIHDAITFLWTGISKLDNMKKLDLYATEESDICLPKSSVEELQGIFKDVYERSYKYIKSQKPFVTKISSDIFYEKMLQLSVQTYLQHKMYPALMRGLLMASIDEDSHLNRNINNAAMIVCHDLDVSLDPSILSKALAELRAGCIQLTSLDKLQCFKNVVDVLSQGSTLSADHLLPYLVVLIIKSKYPKWQAQMKYLKNFNICCTDSYDSSHNNFIITSLEAALKYIEENHVFHMKDSIGSSKEDLGYFMLKNEELSFGVCESRPCVAHLFEEIKLGKHDQIETLLSKPPSQSDSNTASSKCHPLCECEVCSDSNPQNTDTIPSISSQDDRGCSCLHLACVFGWPKVVKKLLSLGSDMSAIDHFGNTALHYAAQRGHKNSLLLLLHASAPVDVTNKHGDTALHLAANNGHPGCVKGLLFYSELHGTIDCNKQNLYGDTPLHVACKYGYKECVTALLDQLREKSCDLQLQNRQKQTAEDCCYNNELKGLVAHTRIAIGTALTLFESRQAFSADLVSRRSSYDSGCPQTSPYFDSAAVESKVQAKNTSKPLPEDSISPQTQIDNNLLAEAMCAVKNNNYKLLCDLLSLSMSHQVIGNKQDLEEVDLDTVVCHPLCQCSRCSAINVKNASVTSSVNLTQYMKALGPSGLGLIHVAAQSGFPDIISLLLSHGCDANLPTGNENAPMPMHLACEAGKTAAVAVLLQHGSNPNAREAQGNTPLHVATAEGHEDIVLLLLARGADANLVNNSGKLPRDLAQQLQLPDMKYMRISKNDK